MFIALMSTGIALLVIGVACLLVANRKDRSPLEQRRLRTAAGVVYVVAVVTFIVAAFL